MYLQNSVYKLEKFSLENTAWSVNLLLKLTYPIEPSLEVGLIKQPCPVAV